MFKVGSENSEVRREVISGVRDIVKRIQSRFKVLLAILYGSFARGDYMRGSDIDLLIHQVS